MPSILNQPIADVIETLLDGASGPVFVVDPAAGTVEQLIEVLPGIGGPPDVRLLAEERVLKEVLDDFLVASSAADLVDEGALSIRTGGVDPGNQLFVTAEEATALVVVGDAVAALGTDEEAFVGAINDHYRDAWEGTEEYSLPTPGRTRVRSTLGEELGEDVEADFGAVLDSLETARGDGEGLDEVTISLLVAARNEELLYDISRWGEDVGIASKATFSRTKTRLEDMGLIDTEKVPIDVGRPRLRLKLAHDRLRDASADELASVARSLMTV